MTLWRRRVVVEGGELWSFQVADGGLGLQRVASSRLLGSPENPKASEGVCAQEVLDYTDLSFLSSTDANEKIKNK